MTIGLLTVTEHEWTSMIIPVLVSIARSVLTVYIFLAGLNSKFCMYACPNAFFLTGQLWFKQRYGVLCYTGAYP